MALRAARPGDLHRISTLLVEAGLPTAGLPRDLSRFVVAEQDGRVAGAAGLERYGAAGLLRSVVVVAEARNRGVGTALVEKILADSAADGVVDIYLLTTTAERYFRALGFQRVARDEVPAEVRASVEFRDACPGSATVMHRQLARSRA